MPPDRVGSGSQMWSPDPVTPVHTPQRRKQLAVVGSPIRKMVLPAVTSSPTRRRVQAGSTPVSRRRAGSGPWADQVRGLLVWCSVSPCVRARGSSAAHARSARRRQQESARAQLSSVWRRWVSLCRMANIQVRWHPHGKCEIWSARGSACDSDTLAPRARQGITALKHAAASIAARCLRHWAGVAGWRQHLLQMSAAALGHWATATQKRAWQAWARGRPTMDAVEPGPPPRPDQPASVSAVPRPCGPEAEAAAPPHSTRSADAVPPLLPDCEPSPDERPHDDVLDGHTRDNVGEEIRPHLVEQACQCRARRLALSVFRAWAVALHERKCAVLVAQLVSASKLKSTLLAWTRALSLARAQIAAHAAHRALQRSCLVFSRWRGCSAADVARAIQHRRQQAQLRRFGQWRWGVQRIQALRSIDRAAVELAILRLARGAVHRWVSWHARRAAALATAADMGRRQSRRMAVFAWCRWRAFIAYRQRWYRYLRKARNFRRVVAFQRHFGRWLAFIETVDQHYAVLRRALCHYSRMTAHITICRWGRACDMKRERRLELLYATGHRNCTLLKQAVREWQARVVLKAQAKETSAAARLHRAQRLKGDAFQQLVAALQARSTLRWARAERLRCMRLHLDKYRLGRLWGSWRRRMAMARCKAAAVQLARRHRLMRAMSAAQAFLRHRQRCKQRNSAARAVRSEHLQRVCLDAWLLRVATARAARQLMDSALQHSVLATCRRCWGGLRARESAFPSSRRSLSTEIYLRRACSCHEIEGGNAWTDVAKRQTKRAREKEALARHRQRLLRHGCRSWLQTGLHRRERRLADLLDAEAQRAERTLRCVLRWVKTASC
jgi:hypothetical protein